MTIVTIDVPPRIMKQIDFLKADRKIGSKADTIVAVLDEYFSQKRVSLIQDGNKI